MCHAYPTYKKQHASKGTRVTLQSVPGSTPHGWAMHSRQCKLAAHSINLHQQFVSYSCNRHAVNHFRFRDRTENVVYLQMWFSSIFSAQSLFSPVGASGYFFYVDSIRGKCTNSKVFVLICLLALLPSRRPSISCLTSTNASYILPQIGNNCKAKGESKGYTSTKGKGAGGNWVAFSAKLLTAFWCCH